MKDEAKCRVIGKTKSGCKIIRSYGKKNQEEGALRMG